MPAAVAAKQARELMEPINQRVGRWQFAIAKLRGLAAHQDGPKAPVSEIAELAADIEQQRRDLDTLVAGVDPSLAAHGRITDTRKALENLLVSVTTLREQLLCIRPIIWSRGTMCGLAGRDSLLLRERHNAQAESACR